MEESRRRYYWVTYQYSGGKSGLFGPFSTEDEAREVGLNNGLIDFDIKLFPTKDQARASQLVKGKRLNDGEGIEKASERLGHERSLRRWQKLRQKMRRSNYGN